MTSSRRSCSRSSPTTPSPCPSSARSGRLIRPWSSSRRTGLATCTTRSSAGACTTGSSTRTSSERSPSSGCEHLTPASASPGTSRRRPVPCASSACTNRPGWRRASTGPRRSPSSDATSSMNPRSPPRSARSSNTGRTRSAFAAKASARSWRRRGVAPESVAVAFVRVLRSAGLDVPLGSTLVYVNALAELDVTSRAQLYWAGRATLVRRFEDVVVYDRVFARFWQGIASPDRAPVETFSMELAVEDETGASADEAAGGDDESQHRPMLVVRASPVEVLRHKDFAQCSDDELDETRPLMDDLQLAGAL